MTLPMCGTVMLLIAVAAALALPAATAAADGDPLRALVGKPADVAPSAYLYRADRAPEANPPEAWVLLMQHLGLPYNHPIGAGSPGVSGVLCGLLWEEVRPIRTVELAWPEGAANRPGPRDLAVTYFDTADDTAHTWWNPRALKEAGPPRVSADGRTYEYAIPVDTWGIAVTVTGGRDAAAFAVPSVRAVVPHVWKTARIEIEWGFKEGAAASDYSGEVTGYDAVLGPVKRMPGDASTRLAGPSAWASPHGAGARRGVRLDVLYIGASRWRRVWPYSAGVEDVARSLVTVRTRAGGFTFAVADLEHGPILAPEYGFFVRAVSGATPDRAASARTRVRPAVHPLAAPVPSLPGVPKIVGWGTGETPWFGVNPEPDGGAAGSLAIPGRCAAMHPGMDRDVVVGWTSPVRDTVEVELGLQMADPAGGNGIDWSLVLDRGAERTALAHGSIDTGGHVHWRTTNRLAVRPGDVLSVVVGPRDGSNTCDTTLVTLGVRSPQRHWSIPGDVVDDVRAGNPHADSYGNAGVWQFAWSEAQPIEPAPSVPPFALASAARSAQEFMAERHAMGLRTIRQRTREHVEQTWEHAVGAMQGQAPLPPVPAPAFEPAMQVDVPDAHLAAQWKLAAWHILRRSQQGPDGTWRFNDYPFGILSSETYMILRALDLQGMHKEAADGLDQWLTLPLQHRVTPGANGHHPLALPDRPLGHFSDGDGALTHAEGIEGWGGHMDAVHAMGPGAIVFALSEHFRVTGDMAWLRRNVERIKANAEWILRQRMLLQTCLPGGDRLWSKGLQPAHVVTPDSLSMHMQYFESEAYYWLAVQRTAEMLALVSPAEGARMAAEAEAYRKDLTAAIDRAILLTPVTPVRDGTYRSFIPFAPYVRGFAAGAWGWKRCQGHVGAIYWDTVQSAAPLVSPSGLLAPHDPRVQGHLDVLEDRLLLENTKVRARTPDFDPERDWFDKAGWQYQCGLERQANIHLAGDDASCFIRSWLNQYAVDIMPGEYTFREHTTGGPPDKIYEESCFIERFRQMLVFEDGDRLWLARATPRAWLANGQRIAVRSAPTRFGALAYEIRSSADRGLIEATVEVPSRAPAEEVVLRLRHPAGAPIKSVSVNGRPWTRFDASSETVSLGGASGRVEVSVRY